MIERKEEVVIALTLFANGNVIKTNFKKKKFIYETDFR